MTSRLLPGVIIFALTMPLSLPAVAQDKPKRGIEGIELTGPASDFYFTRNYNSYYWREDFTFILKDEKSGITWRILSREPTPAYDWRMGTTFTGLKVDWSKKPRVKILGVTGVDRLPTTFYQFKLDEPKIATAHVVWVDAMKQNPSPPTPSPKGERGESWKEYNVNNWFHKWSDQADPIIYRAFADKGAPYDIYGFIQGQSAPFSKKSQKLIEQHAKARMFHGLIKTNKDQAFGYEIELLHLVGPDAGGNGVVFHGEAKTLPMLEKKK